MTIFTTRHLHALLHLKVVIDHLQAIEQRTLTPREREVVQESRERAYAWAESLLPPDLLYACLARAGHQHNGGHPDAAQ